MRNAIFLDYDGVVNTPMWDGDRCSFGFPDDGKVNNYQAVRWLNKLCKQTKAEIIVTSTWRHASNYKACLYRGGLDKDIKIVDKTPRLYGQTRDQEILSWIKHNRGDLIYDRFIIIDDEPMHDDYLKTVFVQTHTYVGFTYVEFEKALNLLEGGD